MSDFLDYENDEDFKCRIIACGRALDQLDLTIQSVKFKVLFYFAEFDIYQEKRVEKFMVRVLRGALNQEDLSFLVQYESFKRQHGQTDEQKLIALNGQRVQAKLMRWYIKIGNLLYGPQDIPAIPNEVKDPPSGYYYI